MRPIAVLASVMALLVAAVTVVWVGKGASHEQPKSPEKVVEKSDLPTPATTGPHPKAVVPETTHDFGVLLHGSKSQHKFLVKNEGQVPLQIKKESSTCQCTGAELDGDAIAPGASAFIEMSWEIRAKVPKFEHSAVLRTNDPAMPTIKLIIQGLVGLNVLTLPEGVWGMGVLNDADPGVVFGYIGSSVVDHFEITSMEPSSTFLKAESTELFGDDLMPVKQMMLSAAPSMGQEALTKKDLLKSAYRITVKTTERGKQGSFSETLTIVTSIPNSEPITVTVNGVNPGAFQFFPAGGARWYPKEMIIDLGDINAAKGKTGSLLMIGRGLTNELKVTDLDVTLPFIKARFEPSGDGASRNQLKLVVDYPAGAPVQSRTTADPVLINFKTNHPLASEMSLKLIFHSAAAQ